MSYQDQTPDEPWLAAVERCQIALYHLAGNTDMPSRPMTVLLVVVGTLVVLLYGWVAICYALPPSPYVGVASGVWSAAEEPAALEPVGAAAGPHYPNNTPTAGSEAA